MSEVSQLAPVYAALILHDEQIAITSDKLMALTKAAGVECEPFWTSLMAKLLADPEVINGLIMNVGTPGAGGGAAAPAAAAESSSAAAPAEEKKEEKKKEEEKEESDEDMGFGLFD